MIVLSKSSDGNPQSQNLTLSGPLFSSINATIYPMIKPSSIIIVTRLFFLSSVLALSLVACDKSEPQSYQAPKDTTAPVDQMQMSPAHPPMPSSQNPSAPVGDSLAQGPLWSLPAGWIQDPTPRSMRVATFFTAASEPRAEIALTTFPGDVGGTLANINRWRGQMGLDPIAAEDQQPMQKSTISNMPAIVLQLNGAETVPAEKRSMLVAQLRQSNPDQTWFIKMIGSSELVAQQEKAFLQFIQSFQPMAHP